MPLHISGQGVVARDNALHLGMPSVILLPDQRIMCAWRQAPDRRLLGRAQTHHCDTNAYIVTATSEDKRSWSTPRLLYAHPLGGCQDPCMHLTNKGTLLCSSYGYVLTEEQFASSDGFLHYADYHFLGGWILRSTDGGSTWKKTLAPRHPDNAKLDFSGKPYHPFNRGAFAEDGERGVIYWAGTRHDNGTGVGAIDLYASRDDGNSWQLSCELAASSRHGLNETSLVLAGDGRLRAYIRSMADHDLLYVATADTVENRSFSLEQIPVQGHPWQASMLADGRMLLVSGYRHANKQIHARLLEPPEYRVDISEMIVVRDGGDSWDIGYPWSVVNGDTALVAYYWGEGNAERYIAWNELRFD